MDAVKKMHGKVLNGRARKIVINVDNYFTKEKEETKELFQQITYALKAASDTQEQEVVISKQIVAEMIVDLQNKARAVERVQEATGVSRKTIGRIRIEKEKAILTGGELKKPMRKKRAKTVFLNESALSVLRNVLNSYTVQNKIPTVRDLLAYARKELDYKGGATTLRRILKNQLGYQFKQNVKKDQS